MKFTALFPAAKIQVYDSQSNKAIKQRFTSNKARRKESRNQADNVCILKLFRMKSTTEQVKTIEPFIKQFFSHLNIQALTPGSAIVAWKLTAL